MIKYKAPDVPSNLDSKSVNITMRDSNFLVLTVSLNWYAPVPSTKEAELWSFVVRSSSFVHLTPQFWLMKSIPGGEIADKTKLFKFASAQKNDSDSHSVIDSIQKLDFCLELDIDGTIAHYIHRT